MSFKHHDEAREAATKGIAEILQRHTSAKAVLIDDIYAKYRLILFSTSEEVARLTEEANRVMESTASLYWSKQIWTVTEKTSGLDLKVYDSAWEEGRPTHDEPRLRIAERHRRKAAWFKDLSEPPWPVTTERGLNQPPIIVFYSFKGGVGRTTSLASFALRRAQAGDRVVVIDGDLDAPGVGNLLGPDEAGTMAQWGVVDYLIERPERDSVALSDYYHSLRRESVAAGGGEILVFPAGVVNSSYLGKLARVDFDPTEVGMPTPWPQFLDHIRQELRPAWILMDSRAGLGESAGVFLGGVGHLNVLLGTSAEQSWQGLRLVLERLGAERIRSGNAQADCIVVQAMVPEDPMAAKNAKELFVQRSEDEFENHYYAEDPNGEEDDGAWFVRDAVAKDAPHRPVPISYRQALAHFSKLDDVISILVSEEYQQLEQRIRDRFPSEQE